MKKCLLLLALLGVVSACTTIRPVAPTSRVAPIRPGENIIVLGDSITHGGHYEADLQLFAALRYPGAKTRVHNCGVSGDTANGGLHRLDWDVITNNPDRVFIMFGMNDVGRNLYNKEPVDAKVEAQRDVALTNYVERMTKIVKRLKEAKIPVVLMTPSPYDEYSAQQTNAENMVSCNSKGLARIAALTHELADKENCGLVEFHEPLTQILKENTTKHVFLGDRVHPRGEGHALMATLILKAMNVSPVVATTTFDKPVTSFKYAPKALPLPYNAVVKEANEYMPIIQDLDQEILTVKGLEPGSYALVFDGKKVDSFTAEEFAKGVNLAVLDTPNQKKAQEAAKIANQLCWHVGHFRNYPLMLLRLREANIDVNDYAACDAYLADWLKKNEKSPYIKSFEYWVKAYHELRDVLSEQYAKEAELNAQLDAIRPVESLVTISKEGK